MVTFTWFVVDFYVAVEGLGCLLLSDRVSTSLLYHDCHPSVIKSNLIDSELETLHKIYVYNSLFTGPPIHTCKGLPPRLSTIIALPESLMKSTENQFPLTEGQ